MAVGTLTPPSVEFCLGERGESSMDDLGSYDRFIATYKTMTFFGVATMVVLCGWFAVVIKAPTSSVRKERLAYIGIATGWVVFGLLLGLADHYDLLVNSTVFLPHRNLRFELCGGVLVALAIGTEIRSWVDRQTTPLTLYNLVLALGLVVATGYAVVLEIHLRDDLRFPEPIIIGIMLAWAFVLGYILSEIVIGVTPLTDCVALQAYRQTSPLIQVSNGADVAKFFSISGHFRNKQSSSCCIPALAPDV
jgi:hypothetical protein